MFKSWSGDSFGVAKREEGTEEKKEEVVNSDGAATLSEEKVEDSVGVTYIVVRFAHG